LSRRAFAALRPGAKGVLAGALVCLLARVDVSAHEFSALIQARKYAEAEQAAIARLAADPRDAGALIARAELIVAQGQENRLAEGVIFAEQCIAAHPLKSECHAVLGDVLGTKAMMGGLMSALGYATKIRDAYKKAVELDPGNLDARFSLLQYFQQAPGIVGGGSGKAQDLASDTAKINPDAGKLMQASIELADKELTKAEALALSANAMGNVTLLETQRTILVGVGSLYARDKKYADAQRVFSLIEKRYPESYWGAYGQGRVLQEQNRHQAALPFLERALAVQAQAIVHYRVGQSLQALGDKARAIAAFELALGFKPTLGKKMRSDAEDQIKALKG
jgi:tetratricopeptide (TPR) repeat protein